MPSGGVRTLVGDFQFPGLTVIGDGVRVKCVYFKTAGGIGQDFHVKLYPNAVHMQAGVGNKRGERGIDGFRLHTVAFGKLDLNHFWREAVDASVVLDCFKIVIYKITGCMFLYGGMRILNGDADTMQ